MKPLVLVCIICCIFSATFLTAAQDDLASIERADGVTLHIESFTYQDEAGSYTPANGVYLVMLMTIDNTSAKTVCVSASDVRLLYDDEEYPPERALMAAVQSELNTRRDYIGPFGGHCVQAGATKCGQMTSCEQARACLAAGNGRLDGDNDGTPCESICGG